ncbi:hypothetical protein ACFC08_16470 [Streptomyces sp. NPDC056112]|uniref:hypothetical protein n=1 Tax=unclassified Streptomyces TaxID=2593676 RepID=UPI001CD2A90B|nr:MULTISPECIES: hypothetical protein [unclassified Streptomyces]
MAEHDSDREDLDGREPVEPAEPVTPAGPVGPADPVGPAEQRADPGVPAGTEGVAFDEAAAWAAIVAGYGAEPPDPPGSRPFRPIEDLALPPDPGTPDEKLWKERKDGRAEDAKGGTNDESGEDGEGGGSTEGPSGRLGSSVSFAPGVGKPAAGPRDYSLAEPSDEDFGEGDEGHFVPPEPPPLPSADPTAKFAWLAVIGGPVLLLLAVLFGWDMTWWLTILGIGGFLGGFATLVMRMKPGDDDEDDPGRGAVV